MNRRRDQRGFMAAEWTAAIGLLLIPMFLLVATMSHVPETMDAAQRPGPIRSPLSAQADSCVLARDAAAKVAHGPDGTSGLVSELHLENASVATNLGKWGAGGAVTVTVTTSVKLFKISTPFNISQSHTEPVDQYRFLDPAACS